MEINVDGFQIDLKVGADPEVFASKAGKLFSAHGLVKGTKELPYPVNKGGIQVDGMALEFNIDPADSCDEFVSNIMTVMKELEAHLPKDVSLAVLPTANFGAQYIASQPDIAKELGCSADLNAYTGLENPKPNAEVPFRTAAGHVHIGWTTGQDIEDPGHLTTCCEFTKVLDLFLGVPSVIADPDTQRRSLYGAAGAFRAKEYGLEYRVLSNFWLKDKAKIKWVYTQVEKAITAFLGGFKATSHDQAFAEHGINNSHKGNCEFLIETHRLKEVPNA